MAYSVIKREFNNSKWIFAPDEFLKNAEKIENIEGAKWIWPTIYSRAYIRKTFILDKVVPFKAKFICDNVFDFFINGKPVSLNKTSFSKDVTSFLREGENRINIRAYQTNDDRFFTSAITGVLESEDVRIYTDESWQAYFPVGIWVNEEPDDWQTVEKSCNRILTCPIHPRLYKRSLYLRKSFTIDKPVEKATLYVSSRGEAEMYINSVRTDDEILSQGVIKDFKEYHVLNVTPLIKQGKNVIGAITANGWLNSESHSNVYMHKNMLLAEIELTYTDGTKEFLGTDNSWKCYFSPMTDNDLQFGIRYDARLEIPSWNRVDFDDSLWQQVEDAASSIEINQFVQRSYPPVYIMRRIAPQKIMVRDTRVIYDFGENCAGRYYIKFNNTFEGQEIKISVCERLDEYGEFVVGAYSPAYFSRDAICDGKALGCMRNFDFYTCAGSTEEEFEPRFTFTGFRYLCVEGIRDKSQVAEICMNVMHNAIKKTGVIKSEYPLVNDLFKATQRTWYSNAINGPMDCPTREKNFWTGDAHLFSATACYLTDVDEFLARWTHAGRKMCAEVYGCGDEKYIIPWTLYQFYRDKGVLENCYEGILKFARARIETAFRGLPKDPGNVGFSDLLSPIGEVMDKYFFACCFYCYMLKIVANIAEVLGDYKTSDEFAALIQPAVDAFNKKFFIPEINDYLPESQGGLTLPLAFGLVPVHREKILAQKLNERVLQDGHITTGFVATKYILGVLCDYGYKDTAFMLFSREKYPSWKNMIMGLNTVPETWKGIADKSDENSISMNNYTFGTVVGWMFEYLGGIRYRESTPGFSHVVLRPTFIKEIGSFKTDFKSVYGLINVEWHIEGNTAVYTFQSERNVTLILPDGTVKAFTKGKHTVVANI